MKRTEQLRIRMQLAGLSRTDLAAQLRLTRQRVGELVGDTGRDSDRHEQSRIRQALHTLAPDPCTVRVWLEHADFSGWNIGRKVRWTRIVLGITLRTWATECGFSVYWWQRFETVPYRAQYALEHCTLSGKQVRHVEKRMHEAAAKLAEVPSWSGE